MLSQVQYVNQKNFIKNWKLGNSKGIPFENHIYLTLLRQAEKYNGKVLVYKTPSSRDDGKDIIIKSSINIKNLMGHDFYLRGRSDITIYIECKSSDSDNISWNQLAGNIARVENDDIQYYVVVTNTTLVPYTYYQFDKNTKEKNITFYLVDQTLLAPFLFEQNSFIGDIENTPELNDIYNEYQVLSYEKEMHTYFEIYLLVRNYKNSTEKIKIMLKTDHDWGMSPSELTIALEKNHFQCLKFIAKRKYYDGINQLSIVFQLNHLKNVIEVKGMNLDFNFIPSLYGKQHYEVVDTLFTLVTNSTTYHSRYLIGESGCGKSRIIDELYKKVSGRNVAIITIKCVNNESKVKQELIKALNGKALIDKIRKNATLSTIINEIDASYQKCVIIFDDIHNLNKNLLQEIRKICLLNLSKAITVILSGRNDFSAGTSEYFSFLLWILSSKTMKGDIIKNLDEPDGINMIRSIISDVPEIVLQKILSKSKCNPLFIIQYIEYLLEINMAHIINRTTVGILNIDTFSTMKYIPDVIEKLYEDRCKILKKEHKGNDMQNFLYIASFIGITFPKELGILHFNGDTQLIDKLIEKKFLMFAENGELCFFHESLYLYFRNKLITHSNIPKSIWKEILKYKEYLNKYDMGVVYYHIEDYKRSAESLADVLESCNHMENYSAANVNQEYYNYLDIVYKLAEIEKNLTLQKKVMIYKIYTALHFYAPMVAVNECIYAVDLMKRRKEFSDDSLFLYTITELKAHGYLNAGQLRNAEQYFMECLTMSLLNSENFSDVSKFDMYDRMAGLYIKYNHFLLAENYNKLSVEMADKLEDDSLRALSLITNAKLNLYIDSEKSEKSLLEAKKLLKTNSRTYCHAELSMIIQRLPLYNNDKEWISATKKIVNKNRELSIENSFSSSVIRSNLVLAVLEFIENRDTHNFKIAEQYISYGIDSSIQYGIATYIWEFYNLKLIIASKLHYDEERIMKIIETLKRMLKQQNLYYLGTLDFCYANVLVLTNIGKYLTRENEFYQFMNDISFNDGHYNSGCNFDCDNKSCLHICEGVTTRFKLEYERIRDNYLLLMNDTAKYSLIDEETGYYIALS